MAEEVYTNEVQTLTGAAGGAWTLTFDGATTTSLVSLETAVNIQNAMNALPNLGGSTTTGVTCTGGPLGTSPVTITFSGTLVKNRNVPQVTSSLGANPVIATQTPGTGYGDGVVVTRFLEFTDEAVQTSIDRLETAGIRATNRYQRTDRWAPGKRQVGGDFSLECPSKGMSMLLSHLFGADPVITTPSGATNTRDHTWSGLGDDFNRSLCFQLGTPDINGTVQPFTYTGGKFPEWEFSCALDGLLEAKCSIDAQNEVTSTNLATASYPSTFEMLYWTGGSASFGGGLVDIRSFKLSTKMNYNQERFFLRAQTTAGGASLKKEPLANALAEITAEIEMEFDGLTNYNRFINATTVAVVLQCEGSIIEAGGGATVNPRFGLQFTMPFCRLDGDTPDVKDMDIVPITLKFKALWDGSTQPITIRYRTTDTAK